MAITDLEPRGRSIGLFRHIGWGAIFCLALTGLVLLGTVAVVVATGIQFGDMTRETAFSMARKRPTSGHHPPYLSALWHLGILAWCVGTAMPAVAAAIAYRHRLDRRWTRFLIASAIFTGMMLLDDLFLLHEFGYPALFNISELTVLATYAVLAVTYLGVFWRELMAGHQALLVLAAAGFATSLAIDQSPLYLWRQVFEDSPKFMGIVCWAGYQTALAVDTADAAVKQSTARALAAQADELRQQRASEPIREDAPTGAV